MFIQYYQLYSYFYSYFFTLNHIKKYFFFLRGPKMQKSRAPSENRITTRFVRGPLPYFFVTFFQKSILLVKHMRETQ